MQLHQGARLENNERPVRVKLYELQLEYVDRMQKGISPLPDAQSKEGLTLGDLLNRYTNIRNIIANEYSMRTGKEPDLQEDSEYWQFRDAVFVAIRDAYIEDPSSWMSKVEECVREKVAGLPQAESFESESLPKKKKQTAGLLNYHVYEFEKYAEYYRDDSFFAKEFPAHGITKEDECMSIHLDPLSDSGSKQADSQSGEPKENLFSQNSFARLAETIVEKQPAVRAVVSRSWLFDTPIAARVGFHVSEKLPIDGGFGLWYQFIDKDGNIKRDEVEQFFKTGEPRFRERDAYILTEELVRKYLPQEKRGQVALRRANPEFPALKANEDIQIDALSHQFDSTDRQGVLGLIEKAPMLGSYIHTLKGKELLSLVLSLKDQGFLYADVLKEVKARGLRKDWEEFINTKFKYLEYVIQV